MNDIVLRINLNIKLKIKLTFILTFAVYSLYLFIQRHPLFPVTVMNLTAIDIMIPFVPEAVYLYESIWFLMPIAPWLMKSKKELYQYVQGIIFISIICFSIFSLYPTSMPRPEKINDINLLYSYLIRFDRQLNAFPSLHVALTIFHGVYIHKVIREGVISNKILILAWLWAAGIIICTLLTKQHMIFDVFGGLIVGLLGYIISNYKKCLAIG